MAYGTTLPSDVGRISHTEVSNACVLSAYDDTLQTSGQIIIPAPFRCRVKDVVFVCDTGVTNAACEVNIKDGAGNSMATGSIPVCSKDAVTSIAENIDKSVHSLLEKHEALEIENDGTDTNAGAGRYYVTVVPVVGDDDDNA
jgi:hypothetical protein